MGNIRHEAIKMINKDKIKALVNRCVGKLVAKKKQDLIKSGCIDINRCLIESILETLFEVKDIEGKDIEDDECRLRTKIEKGRTKSE